jgi:hypothetical protein
LIIVSLGDLGAFDLEGRVLCLGREDQQVKVNGQRIELGEIEAALRQQSAGRHGYPLHSLAQPRLVAFFEYDSVERLIKR